MYDRLTLQEITNMEAARAMANAGLSRHQRIMVEVAAERDVTMDELLGPCRLRCIAWARQDAMLRIRRELNLSLPQIGRIFKRDHTTVMHGIRRAIEREERQ
jgi:chromosomal replication initiator protein